MQRFLTPRLLSVDMAGSKSVEGLASPVGVGPASARPTSPATAISVNLASVSISTSTAVSPAASSPSSPDFLVHVDELAAMLTRKQPPVLLLDVRPEAAFRRRHIHGAHHLASPDAPLPAGYKLTEADLLAACGTEDARAAVRGRAGAVAVLIDDGSVNPRCLHTTLASASPAGRVVYEWLAADAQLAAAFLLAEPVSFFAGRFRHLCVEGEPASSGSGAMLADTPDAGGGGGLLRSSSSDSLSAPVKHAPAALRPLHLRPDDELRSVSLDALALQANAAPAAGQRTPPAASRLQQRHARRLPGLQPLAVPSPSLPNLSLKAAQEPTNYRFLPPSCVFPWLWMGGDADAADAAKLRALGVRYIVNVARECENHHAATGEFVYKKVAGDDHIESEFENDVAEACRFIAAARRKNDGNVFVHCRAGISRSATVVIAYLVQEEHWGLRNAIDHVRAARSCVAPNLGFLLMLMGIERRVHGADTLSGAAAAAAAAAPAATAAAAAAAAATSSGGSPSSSRSPGDMSTDSPLCSPHGSGVPARPESPKVLLLARSP